MHCPGNIRLFCPPLPPMHAASPPCGHPAGTQRVQRLRQCSVAGGSSGDSFAALASVGSARAACPFPLAYTRRGMPHSGRFCRAPGIVGSVSRRCCGDRVFHRYAFFLCRSRKKREVLSIKHNNPIEGRRKRRLFPSIILLYLIPVPTPALPPVGTAVGGSAVPRPHARGWDISFRLRRAVCAAHPRRVVPPAVRPSLGSCPPRRPIPFPPASPDDAGRSGSPSGSHRALCTQACAQACIPVGQ